jgi:hypothetical protein
MFDFLERMAQDVDRRVREVLGDTVLELLRDESAPLRQRAAQYMGDATRACWAKYCGSPGH